MAASPSTIFDLARRAGMFDPRRLPSLSVAVARWGPTLAAPYAAAAIATPTRAAILDDQGPLSFADLDAQSTELAHGLHRLGVRRGDRLGIDCRNHRDFVVATVAAAKLAVSAVYLNTGFSGPQLRDVLASERIDALIVDAALHSLLDATSFAGPVVIANTADARTDATTIIAVRRSRGFQLPLPPSLPAAPVLLTSGTTGTPKGANRTSRPDASSATGILEAIPYRHDDVFLITSPLFHAWGLAQLGIAGALGATAIVTERFDAESTLALVERERVTVLAVVPTILKRLLDSSALDDADLSSLRIVASSGAALPVPVVEGWLTRGGHNLYNLYGSTEVGQATIAVPNDLRTAANTAGRALPGTTVRILDKSGTVVPAGVIGRIFVGNGNQFDGYTGGGGKEVIDGLMSSGDVGFFDDDGLLFVTGRADDMIVSGGENVFPVEIEDLLLSHPKVLDVAVVGVHDDEFGQRLAAHIVVRPGSRLGESAVKQFVADRLARHKVPRDVHFVDELPRTVTGKIRRNQL
jgi:fatty-acyl-CoA synthase